MIRDDSSSRIPCWPAWTIGLIGAGGSVIGWIVWPGDFYRSYLCSYAFVLTIVLGMLFFVMLHHVTDAGWSTIVRRLAEHVLAAMPILTALIAPVLVGAHELLHADMKRLTAKLAIYFASWLALTWFFRGGSLRQDRTADPMISLPLRRWSAPGLILFAVTFTFAAIDLLMSLEPHWHSTVFGIYVFGGSVVASLCVMTLMSLLLNRKRLGGMISQLQLHDLGRLLFAFSVFWAYIAFSQYFLIWYANVPEETAYYLKRWEGHWKLVSIALPVGRFALPFMVLMSGAMKRRAGVLASMSVSLLIFHWLDVYWMTMPRANPLVDLSTVAAIGGLCAIPVVQSMNRHALYPIHDPRLAEVTAASH